MLEVLPLGGLGEVGRNMTAVSFGDGYVVVDMGVRLDAIQAFEDANLAEMSLEELVRVSAIPDDRPLRKKEVKAIFLTHGHLDHIGAVGKLARPYRAPLYGTPFTLELVKRLVLGEEKLELVPVKPGERVEVGDLEVEFLHANHSIPQTVFLLLREGERSLLLATDFKLDETPLLGPPTDLEELKKKVGDGLEAALVGAVRVDEPGPTGSEAKAREMLEETMEKADKDGRALLVTTFSSHLTRIRSIVEISEGLGRTPVLVGRSMKNYFSAAVELNLPHLPHDLPVHGSPGPIKKFLKKANGSRGDYVLICTGHQGEPTSVLSKIADRKLPFRLQDGDQVIFSASVIPNPINQNNRSILETKLLVQGARIHRDVHVSGHAARADTAEFLRALSPKHLLPCHGTPEKLEAMMRLGRELGYGEDRLHLLENGKPLRLAE
ncbi:MAG: MBL fold metallo-hydrolase [Candidatus Hadarchaeales archaeon]